MCAGRSRDPAQPTQNYGQQLGSGQLCSGLNILCACSCAFARVPVSGCVCACTRIQRPEVEVWCLSHSSIPLYLALQIFF